MKSSGVIPADLGGEALAKGGSRALEDVGGFVA